MIDRINLVAAKDVVHIAFLIRVNEQNTHQILSANFTDGRIQHLMIPIPQVVDRIQMPAN